MCVSPPSLPPIRSPMHTLRPVGRGGGLEDVLCHPRKPPPHPLPLWIRSLIHALQPVGRGGGLEDVLCHPRAPCSAGLRASGAGRAACQGSGAVVHLDAGCLRLCCGHSWQLSNFWADCRVLQGSATPGRAESPAGDAERQGPAEQLAGPSAAFPLADGSVLKGSATPGCAERPAGGAEPHRQAAEAGQAAAACSQADGCVLKASTTPLCALFSLLGVQSLTDKQQKLAEQLRLALGLTAACSKAAQSQGVLNFLLGV